MEPINCQQSQALALDMDGVLCEDFVGDEGNAEEYLSFLERTRPRWLPRRMRSADRDGAAPTIPAPTLLWLARYGVRVRQL